MFDPDRDYISLISLHRHHRPQINPLRQVGDPELQNTDKLSVGQWVPERILPSQREDII